jgi:TolA-binding protein
VKNDDRLDPSDAGEKLDRTVRRAFSGTLGPHADDHVRIEAAIDRTLLAVQTKKQPSLRPGRSVVYLVAAALGVGALAYAAGHRSTDVGSSSLDAPAVAPPPPSTGGESAPSAVAFEAPTSAPAAKAPPAEALSPEVLPSVGPPHPRPAPVVPSAAAKATTNEAPPVASAPVSAAELFARANDARRTADTKRAIALYDELQTRFPDSREASTSRVALGRLLLDREGEPARARALFEGYLEHDPSGALAEEARVGRAQALMRLGERNAEREAWLELLERHPTSVHAERARQRLAALGN